MASLLSNITSIDEEILTGLKLIEPASVAQRMSWSVCRITTRTEDLAYCLIDIFSVNMPMPRGEAARACIRLQEELMKVSDDETLFAWIGPEFSPESTYGLLATSPASFTSFYPPGTHISLPHHSVCASARAQPIKTIKYSFVNITIKISPHMRSHVEMGYVCVGSPKGPDNEHASIPYYGRPTFTS
ncbi:hypothetical protein MMC34_005141 [Xylographa carneopallida]|nr:hypothetical protein [Xylographa carneopallida]